MNLADQIARHQVPGVWMPNPEAHLNSVRDRTHFEWAKNKIASLHDLMPDTLKILDVGCYDGWLDFLLLDYFEATEIDGLELIPNLCASARAYVEANGIKNYRTIEGTLWAAGNPAHVRHDYDAILCFEMLEHIYLEEVPQFLILMEAINKPTGRILLSLPDQRHEDNPQHLWTPTKSVIDELLKNKKGATVEYKSYPGTDIPGNFFIEYLP